MFFECANLFFRFRTRAPPLIALRGDLENAPPAAEPVQPVARGLDQASLAGQRIEADASRRARDPATMSDDEVARLLAELLPESLAEEQGRDPIVDETIDVDALSIDQLDQLPDEQITRLLQDLTTREGVASEQIERLIPREPSDALADLSDERVDELLIQMLRDPSAATLSEREQKIIETHPASYAADALDDHAIKTLLARFVQEKGEDAMRALLEEAVSLAIGDDESLPRATADDKIRFKWGGSYE